MRSGTVLPFPAVPEIKSQHSPSSIASRNPCARRCSPETVPFPNHARMSLRTVYTACYLSHSAKRCFLASVHGLKGGEMLSFRLSAHTRRSLVPPTGSPVMCFPLPVEYPWKRDMLGGRPFVLRPSCVTPLTPLADPCTLKASPSRTPQVFGIDDGGTKSPRPHLRGERVYFYPAPSVIFAWRPQKLTPRRAPLL